MSKEVVFPLISYGNARKTLTALFGEQEGEAQLRRVANLHPSPFLEAPDVHFLRLEQGQTFSVGKENLGDLASGKMVRPALVVWTDNYKSLSGNSLASDLVSSAPGLWVIEEAEKKLDRVEESIRMGIMEDWGLVHKKVVQQYDNGKIFFVWHGREREERRRKAIDLTCRSWFEEAVTLVISRYEQEGWKEIDLTEARRHCQRSTYALRDWYRLHEWRYGVRLTAECGCSWKIPWQGGDPIRISQCTESCSGIPVPKRERPEIPAERLQKRPEQLTPKEGKERRCGDCGGVETWDPNACNGGKWVCPCHIRQGG
jgi:hypothetical protein